MHLYFVIMPRKIKLSYPFSIDFYDKIETSVNLECSYGNEFRVLVEKKIKRFICLKVLSLWY